MNFRKICAGISAVSLIAAAGFTYALHSETTVCAAVSTAADETKISDFEYHIKEDAAGNKYAEILGYKGDSASVIIPDTITYTNTEYKVKSILFRNNDKL